MITDHDALIEHVSLSITHADTESTPIWDFHREHSDRSPLNIWGFSSAKIRTFLNNLCSFPQLDSYLEIGVLRGSTLVPACFFNRHLTNVVAIDNWSQFHRFGENFDIFTENLKTHQGNMPDIRVIESDCWNVDVGELGKFDVYFYDGGHNVEEQEKAFVHYWDALNDTCVILVDDWNDKDVKEGTRIALAKLPHKELFREELIAHGSSDQGRFWNGLLVLVLEKC